jgi:hypothetical protein
MQTYKVEMMLVQLNLAYLQYSSREEDALNIRSKKERITGSKGSEG